MVRKVTHAYTHLDALWNGEKWDHSWDRKMAKRIAHERQIKIRKAMGRNGSMRYECQERDTHKTK